MDALLLAWIVATSVVAIASAIGCGWLVARLLRGTDDPADGWGCASFAGFGIMALVALAIGLGKVGMAWAVVGLVVVNLLMQPFFLYLFAAGTYKLVMASAGRVTYAWHILPRGDCPKEEYRQLRWYCVFQGVVGCSLAAVLAWVCLSPLL